MRDILQNDGYHALLLRGGRLTRFKGKVATIAPALLALAVAAPLALHTPVAMAACTLVGNLATCSGTDNTTQTINFTDPGAAKVDILSSYQLTAGAGNGLNITSNGQQTALVIADDATNPASITAPAYAVQVQYKGSGAVDLLLHGDLTTTSSDDALYVGNDASGGDIIIETRGTVKSVANYGIHVEQNGTGRIRVTTTGTVEGNTLEGMMIKGLSADTRDIIIDSSAAVIGQTDGIEVRQQGDGDVRIIAKGLLQGKTQDGVKITVFNDPGGDVTAYVADIEAGQQGLDITQNGSGLVTVSVSGNITGVGGAGNRTAGDAIHIETDASAGSNITGSDAVEIFTTAGKTLETQADGIDVLHKGEKGVSITSDAAIDAGADGIRTVMTSGNAGALTIEAKGQITADNSGILASSNGTGDVTITTSASITANGNNAGDFGIGAEHTGSSGNISITAAAVDFNGTGTAEAAIGARRTGTANGGDVFINNTGAITSDAHGISIEVGSNITGDAVIRLEQPLTAAYSGAYIQHAGTGNAAIIGQNNGTVVANGNATGDVGLGIEHSGTGNISIATNANVQFDGTGNAEYAIDATHTGKGNIGIYAYGEVVSKTHGVSAEHTGTGEIFVYTAKKVTSDGVGIGVIAGSNVSKVTVHANGAIDNSGGTSNSNGIHVSNQGKGSTSITANGAITARKDGIFLSTGNDTTIAEINTSAAVSGQENGIDATHNGTDPLNVGIGGDVTGGTGYAIKTATKAGNITNLDISNATVSAASGLAISNNQGDSDIAVDASATIQGDISLGDGTDILTFNGGDLSGITLFDGGDDTQAGDGWVDQLTFSGVAVTTNAGIIQNWEVFSLINNSDVQFNNGTMNVGLLQVDGGSKAHFKDTGGTITGDLANAGTVDMQDGVPDDPLTVQGDYSGDGTVLLDTQLGDSASPTDQLVVQGDNSGNIQLNIQNAGGTGAFTGLGPTDGIRVVDIQGTNTGSLTLANGPLFAGAYIYQLTPTGYLQSQPVGDGMALAALQTLLPEPTESLWERVSSTWAFARAGETTTQAAGYSITPTAATPIDMVNGLWLRGYYRYSKADANLRVAGVAVPGITAKENRFWMQLGYTHGLMQDANGTLALSAYAQYKHAKVDLGWASLNPADVKSDGFGGGASLTWLGSNGLYADVLGEITFHKLRFTNNILAVSNSTRATTWRVSMETGMRIPLEQQVNLIPQAQLHVRGANFRTFTVGGATMSDNTDAVVTGRLGMALEFVNLAMGDGVGLTGQITASVLHDFNRPGSISVNGTPVEARFSRTQGELRSNLSFDVQDSGVSFFLENRFRHSLTGPKMYSLKSSAGIKVRF